MGLPDAVDPVASLVLDLGVPPGIEVDDRIREDEVKAHSAGFLGDQHDLGLAFGIEIPRQSEPFFACGVPGDGRGHLCPSFITAELRLTET